MVEDTEYDIKDLIKEAIYIKDNININNLEQVITSISFFTTGTNLYDSFGIALTTKLANHAAKHALNMLLETLHSNLLIFNLIEEVKLTSQLEDSNLMSVY